MIRTRAIATTFSIGVLLLSVGILITPKAGHKFDWWVTGLPKAYTALNLSDRAHVRPFSDSEVALVSLPSYPSDSWVNSPDWLMPWNSPAGRPYAIFSVSSSVEPMWQRSWYERLLGPFDRQESTESIVIRYRDPDLGPARLSSRWSNASESLVVLNEMRQSLLDGVDTDVIDPAFANRFFRIIEREETSESGVIPFRAGYDIVNNSEDYEILYRQYLALDDDVLYIKHQESVARCLLRILLRLTGILLLSYSVFGVLVYGRRAFLQRQRQSKGRCWSCGYDLSGLDTMVIRCPECGAELPSRTIQH